MPSRQANNFFRKKDRISSDLFYYVFRSNIPQPEDIPTGFTNIRYCTAHRLPHLLRCHKQNMLPFARYRNRPTGSTTTYDTMLPC